MKIDITPMAAPRMTQNTYWKHKKYFKYKNDLKLLLPGYDPGLSVHISFYLPFPKSYGKNKRAALEGTYHDQKPDLDNLIKGFTDCFGEDKKIAVIHAEKYWAEHGAIEIL